MTKKPAKLLWKGIGPQTQARILKALKPRLDAAAVLVQGEIIQSFGSAPPEPFKRKEGFKKNSSKEWKMAHPSRPGEPPHVVTSRLKNSIGWDAPTPLTRRIGSGIGTGKTNPGYAFFLEFGTIFMYARPFLRPGLARKLPEVRAILGGKK